MTRHAIRVVALLLIIGLATFAIVRYDVDELFEVDEVAAVAQRDTTVATITNLVNGFETDGQLVFADARNLVVNGEVGVVTAVVESESTVHRGDVLWRVVGEPVVAFLGEIPMSRRLANGSIGADVQQLEENLVLLGYDPARTVTIDDEYTTFTEAMVQRWQEDIGAEVTGTVEHGAVVFLPAISRVGETAIDVGDAVSIGSLVMALTSPQRSVEFTVASADRDSLAVGDTVSVRLPDRSTVDATVEAVTILADGSIDVQARPGASIGFSVDTIPVTVTWKVPLGPDALTVPAGALIRTDRGTYNVEVRRPSGVEELVAVEVGRTSGVIVEILGDVSEGDVIIAP